MTTPPQPDGPLTGRRRPQSGRGARPTGRAALLVALLAVLTVALPLGVLVPSLLLGVLSGAVLVDVVAASRSSVHGQRTQLPTMALGVPVPYAVGVVTSLRPARTRQPVPNALLVVPDEVAGGGLVGVLTGRHRGTHELAPALVRATGPLGLGSADHHVGREVTVSVLPDLPKARRAAVARRRGRASDEGPIRSRLGIGTEFETLRDYVPDDDIRQVNWVASARVGRPMSNQYRVEENRDLLCAVDTGRLMASPVGERTRLDVALEAVTAVAAAADAAGDRAGALAFSASVTRELDPRRRGAAAVVRALFDLEATEVESDYERAFVALARRKRALVAVFSDLVDESASRALVGACRVLARRHAVIVATCRDPDLTAAVTHAPASVLDVLRAAVAVDVLAGRERASTLLRSAGVTVVEAPPERLGPACVHAYLRLKQRARL